MLLLLHLGFLPARWFGRWRDADPSLRPGIGGLLLLLLVERCPALAHGGWRQYRRVAHRLDKLRRRWRRGRGR
ncbi:MAG: hypothetical protein SV108_09100 [Pseudomonadota bacterium]|nr:hypothetical protein [Pseudomonadota bacterium]